MPLSLLLLSSLSSPALAGPCTYGGRPADFVRCLNDELTVHADILDEHADELATKATEAVRFIPITNVHPTGASAGFHHLTNNSDGGATHWQVSSDDTIERVVRFVVAYVSESGILAVGRGDLVDALRRPESFGVASLSCPCPFTALCNLQDNLGSVPSPRPRADVGEGGRLVRRLGEAGAALPGRPADRGLEHRPVEEAQARPEAAADAPGGWLALVSG